MTAREREKEIRAKLALGHQPSWAEGTWLLDRNERLERALRHEIQRNHEHNLNCSGCADAESILNESDANKTEGSE